MQRHYNTTTSFMLTTCQPMLPDTQLKTAWFCWSTVLLPIVIRLPWQKMLELSSTLLCTPSPYHKILQHKIINIKKMKPDLVALYESGLKNRSGLFLGHCSLHRAKAFVYPSELEFNVPFQHKHGYIRDEFVYPNQCWYGYCLSRGSMLK